MKVNNTNRIDYVGQAYKKNSEDVGNLPKKPSPHKLHDTLELSRAGRELNNEIKKINETEDFDRKKVDAIKQAIQKGTYKISPDAIAEKMVQAISEQNRTGEE